MSMTTSAGARCARALALAILGLGVIVAVPRAARADAYKDEKLGYSVSAPGKWKQMPLSTDEQWKVAEWQYPREMVDADVKTNSWTRQQPKLDVVVIPLPAAEPKGAEARKDGDKAPAPASAQSPWRDLREYMDKAAQKAGFSNYTFTKEEEGKIGALKVVTYEITVDKFTSTYNNAPRRFYGWAFYGDDAIYGLVGDALVKFEDKVKPELEAAAKSFRIFPRTGALPGAEPAPAAGADPAAKKDPAKVHLTDEDLKKRRADAFTQQLAKVKASLPDGWSVKETENFAAVTHCDDKFTREVLDHAEALRAWLDQNLGFVGSGFAGKVLLRVCADENERSSLAATGYSYYRCEVVTGQDKRGWAYNKLSALNDGIYAIWLRDKNAQLADCLPPWLASGMTQCVSSAVSKGRKISEFKATTWDNVTMANLRRAGQLVEARTFFTMSSEAKWENAQQSEAFVRFLLVGGAHANPKYKNVLSDYIKNLVILLDEQHDAKTPAAEPKNEEEEVALRRARAEAWKAAEPQTLKKLVEATFPGWDDAQWNAFNQAYLKELGG